MTVMALGATLVDLARGEAVARLPEAPESLVQGGGVVCALRHGRLRAFSLPDAAPRWEAPLPGVPVRQLTLDGDEVFALAGGALCAFDAGSGARRDIDAGATVERVVARGDRLVARLAGGAVQLLTRAGAPIARVEPFAGERLANGVDHLLEGRDDVAAVLLEALEREFVVRGLGADGCEAWQARVEHSEVLSRDQASGVYFFLNFEQAGAAHLLFTSHWSTYRRPAAVVLRTSDGARVAEVERHVSSLVERPDGSLEGLLCVDSVRGELALLDPGTPARPRWSSPAPSSVHRRADAAWTPDGLLVAQYDAITAGARLVLLDPLEGHTRWQAEVAERPPYERTPLFVNAWSVSVFGDRVLLTGDESAGSTAQVFDLRDGRRLYADLNV